MTFDLRRITIFTYSTTGVEHVYIDIAGLYFWHCFILANCVWKNGLSSAIRTIGS